jgi:hypothetical protein
MESRTERRLASAIVALAFELGEWRKERTAKLVTVEDLKAAEERILQAISRGDQLPEDSQRLLAQTLSRTSKHAVKLEALDAMTE